MQDLKRLAKIIADNSPKALPVIDQTDQISLEGRLYHYIKENQVLTDEEACLHLYGETKLTPSYRMLKSRLRKKLLNSLFFIELPESHLRKSGILHAECFSLLQQASKLVTLNEFTLADKLAEQAIAIAQRAELNDMLAKAYEIKIFSYSTHSNRSGFEKYFELLQHCSFIEAKEREAFIVYFTLKLKVSYNLTIYRKEATAYRESLEQLKTLWETTGSSKVYDYYYMMLVTYRELLGDYEGILNAIDEAECLLEKASINKLWFNTRFNSYMKVYACLRLNKIDDGLQYAIQNLSSFIEGSANWFNFLENYLILALYKKNYSLAVQLSNLAISKGVFENVVLDARERWGVLLRYVVLLTHNVLSDKLNPPFHKEQVTAIISKDKEGLNLPLLILEYLENLPKLDEEDMAQYATRFSKYASKYLKDAAADRNKLFIKLLLLSMKEEGEKLEQKAASLLGKLRNTPPPRDPVGEVEIVPYEHLWEVVIGILKAKSKE